MRVMLSGSAELEQFSQWLLSIGDGTCGDGVVEIPESMMTPEETLDSLIDCTFPNLEENYTNCKWLGERTVVCPTNAEADEVNNFMVEKFFGDLVEYKSIDTTEENNVEFTPEFLNTCSLPGMAPHLLRLKRGVPVVLLRNLDPKNGHCNGVKYVVHNMKKHVLELKAISGSHIGSFLLLPRIIMISQVNTLPFTLRRKQFPIKLCFAGTSNKYVIIFTIIISSFCSGIRASLLRWWASTVDRTSSPTARPMSPTAGLEPPVKSRFSRGGRRGITRGPPP